MLALPENLLNQNSNIKRNITIYIVGVLLLSSIGGLITAAGNEIGGLIFVISPILMAVLLRTLGGDGWKDAGLGLKLKEHWRWYLFSLFVYPIAILIVVGLGVLLGLTSINAEWNTLLPAFLSGIAAQLFIRILFAMFEEWGWRGYLEPRLLALGVPDLQRHLLIGVLWAVWHFPLILSTDYTHIPYAIFLPLFVVGVATMSVVYGQLRKASETVWTSVLMHGIANALAWAIIQGDSITFNNKVLAYCAPESVLMILLFSILAFWMLYKRKATA
jgi:membrane protease YdiL (CAAX protease family)